MFRARIPGLSLRGMRSGGDTFTCIQLQHTYFGVDMRNNFDKRMPKWTILVLLGNDGRQGRTFNEGRVGYPWSWGEGSLFI